jgi:hypothetical protein
MSTTDPRSPYRKYLRDRRKVVSSIPQDNTNSRGGLETKGGGIGSLYSKTIDRKKRKRQGELDQEDTKDLALFGYTPSDGATIVHEDTHTFEDGAWT